MHDLPHDHDHDEQLPTPRKSIRCGSSTRSPSPASASTSARRLRRLFFHNWCCAASGGSCPAALSSPSATRCICRRFTLRLTRADRERIDDQALGRFWSTPPIGSGHRARATVDTGAIILTGEAIRRDNARAIADLFRRAARQFRLRHGGPQLRSAARRPRLGRGRAIPRSSNAGCSTSTSAAAPPSSRSAEQRTSAEHRGVSHRRALARHRRRRHDHHAWSRAAKRWRARLVSSGKSATE